MTRYKHFDLVMALSITVLIVSNIVATKLISFGAVGPLLLIFDGGAILFPLAYIINDILTEVYGYRYARRVMWAGFVMMMLAVLTFTAVRYLPPDASYASQAAYEAVLGYVPRIVVASLAAYLCGEFLNSYVLAKMKVATGGRHLWARLVGSTVLGELIDTTVFCLIAFGGEIPWSDMASYIVLGWAFKTFVEILLLPVTYRVIAWLKRTEGVDYFDRDTNFNPFSISVDEPVRVPAKNLTT